MAHETELLNYVGGVWQRSHARDHVHVTNPATGVALADVPLSPAQEVDAAVRAAAAAWPAWRRVPPLERIQYLFKLKQRLEDALPMLARTITEECGKTLAEAEGEIRRGIENVEVATGVPTTMMGVISEDIASGVDELMIRQPIGVVAIITPFNFPGMIPLWFLPYALATGNTVVMKPSEKTPRTMAAVMLIVDELKLPKGVVNLVHGGREASEALCDHPDVRAVSFVGSTAVARAVYARATAAGKRAQCQGGAKNPIIVLPDADMDMTTRIAADSAFGCAGQRCLAASVAITVGEARDLFTPRITEVAAGRRVGNGLEPGAVEIAIGHTVDGDQLDGSCRRELQIFLGEPLDALRAIEQAPFGAEHGDGIALLIDLLAERGDFGIERTRLVLHLIDDVSDRHEAKDETDIDETQHFGTRELKSALTCKD